MIAIRGSLLAIQPPVTALCINALVLCAGTMALAAPGIAAVHDDGVPISAVAPADTAATSAGAPANVQPNATLVGTQVFNDRRNPPSYRKLSEGEFARYDLGMAVFNTQFVPAGTPNAGRRAGVGPLFNSASCDSCHNNGARGRGPTEDGPAPVPLVIQLATIPSKNPTDPEGDPAYGRVFNTIGLAGVPPEGVVTIRYEETSGLYPDGSAWHLRVPHYTLNQLRYGPLSPRTIVKPRLAPALFGSGLLDAAIVDRDSGGVHGRFGWQATAISVRDQTVRAFAREMGLTSADMKNDDCTPTETACVQQAGGRSPEVSDDIFNAVLSFQRWLAVPASPIAHATSDPAAETFVQLGCATCHQPLLPVALTDAAGNDVAAVIAPYTDLRVHDLGSRLADETVSGKKVRSKWRTAPLWGLGYRMSLERFPTFLHDGRARSAEEAILWHDGEAAGARNRFTQLPVAQRKAFLRWIETL